MPPKPKFYVVWKGRKTGVFTSWQDCAAQVQGFTGAQYKSFLSRSAAEVAFRSKASSRTKKPLPAQLGLLPAHAPLPDGYCVDAACSGSPGPLEYRGIDLRTGRQVFRQGPFQNGTNNVGEFLAIVHMLMWLEKKHSPSPVYSDSSTAIGWVRKKRCNTELALDGGNAPLFERIDKAEDWLAGHVVPNPILKWDTRNWGEIPADFGRK